MMISASVKRGALLKPVFRFLIFMLATLAPVAWFLISQQVLITLAIVKREFKM